MAQNITLLGASYTAVPAVTLPKTGGGTAKFSDASVTTAVESDVTEGKTFLLADGSIGTGTASGGGDEPSGPTYETIVPLQTINCSISLSNGAYGGYITNYTEYTAEGQKYRVIFDDVEYTPLTAAYYGGTTNYLYIGDANVEASSAATLTYPFEVMLYGDQTFYLGVRGSGSHTLQVDKITSEGSGGGGDTASNPLKGKIATFTGDSICQGAGYAGGYAKIIGEDYDMTIENIGVSDGTVVRWQNKFCISESIADMRSDADFVMLEGGGNDADWGPQYIPVGTLSSGYDATLDTTTFAGALETMLKSAIARFPNAKIGYIFPHKCIANFDSPSGAYRNMAISALEKWGIPYCDLNISVPPLGYIDDLKTAYTRGDGIHPNEAGYRTFYAPKIAAFMQTMLTDKTLINKTVTANGTYSASDDSADGYSSVTVNVNHTDSIVVKSRDSDGYPTELDYYNSDGIVPAQTFCNTRSVAALGWCYGRVTKINLKGSNSFKVYGDAFRGMHALTDPDFSKITELANNGSNNTGDSATFQTCAGLLTVNAPNLTGGLPVYCFYDCKKLVSVYLPKINAINGYSNNRGSFGNCSALTTCEFGSVGYPITFVQKYAFHSCPAIETMTFYAKSDYVDELLVNVRTCVTTGTIIVKASEATTYGGTSYAAGDTIVTSTP